jgi:hypothetical protein
MAWMTISWRFFRATVMIALDGAAALGGLEQ